MIVRATSNISKLTSYLDKHADELIFCDIETTSLSMYHGKIVCVAFIREKSDTVIVYYPKTQDELKQLTIKKAVFHNAHFDQVWLEYYGASVTTVWDTMLMAHLINENNSVSLKYLGQHLLGYPDWTEEEIKNIGHIPKERVSTYVAKDVWVTRELYRYQLKYLKNQKPGENAEFVLKTITLPAILPLSKMEHNKLPVRIPTLKKEIRRVETQLQAIDTKLYANVPPDSEIPEYLRGKPINWGSSNWTRWWIYIYQGATCTEFGKPTKIWKEGAPSLSASALSKVNHPAAKLLQERSALNKQLTGFLIPILERAQDKRVATSFKLTGTVTGRLSSSSPNNDNPGINSQQIPRDKAIRNLFGEKGKAWIEADYSQLELRVAAVMAHETTMMKLFAENQDIHTYMAQRLVGQQEVTKEQRSLAKGVNFGFLYGMHANHFANYLQETYGLIISPQEAEAFREEYFATFNKLPVWYAKQKDFALTHGGVANAFGRFRHLPKVYSDDYWVQENAFRQAINSPVQSTGSDFMLISLGRIARDKTLADLGAKLITTVHDSVCLTAPYKTAKEVAIIVKSIMERADDMLTTPYHLKVDVSISRYWGGEPLAEY